jgi:hypothetical protein
MQSRFHQRWKQKFCRIFCPMLQGTAPFQSPILLRLRFGDRRSLILDRGNTPFWGKKPAAQKNTALDLFGAQAPSLCSVAVLLPSLGAARGSKLVAPASSARRYRTKAIANQLLD